MEWVEIVVEVAVGVGVSGCRAGTVKACLGLCIRILTRNESCQIHLLASLASEVVTLKRFGIVNRGSMNCVYFLSGISCTSCKAVSSA